MMKSLLSPPQLLLLASLAACASSAERVVPGSMSPEVADAERLPEVRYYVIADT